jgi:hypothetical protein
MTQFSLREAAREAGTSKSSLCRAVASGRVSATRTEDGRLLFDPAELFRAFPPKPTLSPEAFQPGRPGTASAGQTGTTVLELQARVRHLEEQLAEARKHCDRWHETATKLAERPLMLPAPETPQRRGFWPWRRAG